MTKDIASELKNLIAFERIDRVEIVQSLWSGYGALLRVYLIGSIHKSVVVKRITPPGIQSHPRGWASDISHQRKLKSYEVEAHWYENYAQQTTANCRIPTFLGKHAVAGGSILLLEDLNPAGFSLRKSRLSQHELSNCLSCLAHFHAQFMGLVPAGLWEIGTYWQLDTRPDEWMAMSDGQLKAAAHAIHQKLNACKFKTIVHGDAKFANFCFAKNGEVAAVDFQYVGGGCGMKDVAYLLSCIPRGISNEDEEELYLSHYFHVLKQEINAHHPELDTEEIESEWRKMYPIAVADFERFLQGWAPGHWKMSKYSALKIKEAMRMI